MMTNYKIQLGDRELICGSSENLLDRFIDEQLDVSYSCRQGVCQSCLMRSLDGAPPEAAQKGLKDNLKQQNYFLACLCYPEQPMRISNRHHADFTTYGTVTEKSLLNEDTLLLTLETDEALDYFAGQFVNLQREDGLMRSYSISNNRIHSKNLSFHIRRLKQGKFSSWAHDQLNIGDRIAVSDPQGTCYYQPNDRQQPIVLIGTGSGLAPLAGIISEALYENHQGDIYLYHGSRDMNGLYWVDEMKQLANQHTNFYYRPCVSQGKSTEEAFAGRANEVAFNELPDLKGWKVFLCGHPEMVNQSKRQAFMQGAAFADIYADSFHVASSN